VTANDAEIVRAIIAMARSPEKLELIAEGVKPRSTCISTQQGLHAYKGLPVQPAVTESAFLQKYS